MLFFNNEILTLFLKYIFVNEKNFFLSKYFYQICIMEKVMENSIQNGISDMLSESVFNAKLLLNYATEHGLEIEEEWIAILIDAKQCDATNKWEPNLEIKFWMAYKQLSKTVRPVSIQSLKATKEQKIVFPNYFQNLFKIKSKNSLTQKAVTRYSLLTLFWILLMLIIQMFSLNGTTLLNNIRANKSRIDKIDERKDEIQLILSSDPAGNKRAELEKYRLEAEKEKLDKEIKSSIKLLEPWVGTIRTITFKKTKKEIAEEKKVRNISKENIVQTQSKLMLDYPKNDSLIPTKEDSMYLSEEELANFNKKQINDNSKTDYDNNMSVPETNISTNIETIQEAQNFTQILQLYLLPLLYGLIGGFVFVLRGLASDIKSVTFSDYSNIKYTLRIHLGALAGLIVGLLWGDIEQQKITFVKSLSTAALAFLAGYGVEYVFDGVDKLISSIVKPKEEDEKIKVK